MRDGKNLRHTLLRLENTEVEIHLISNPERDYLVGHIIEVGEDYLHLGDAKHDAVPKLIPFSSIAYVSL